MARSDPPGPRTIACIIAVLSVFITSSHASDAEALSKLKDSFTNADTLNWNLSTSPCSGNTSNWIGIFCSKGSVWGIQLESMGLMGTIDVDTLTELPSLRTISFMNNSFDGPIPDIHKLGALKSIFLSHNKFSGDIPKDNFKGMGSLKKLYLNDNMFTGNIPLSLLGLTKLLELRLDGNQFEGQIPNFEQKGLKFINFSNNRLEGPIPESLSKMDKKYFAGNQLLCGGTLGECNKRKITAGAIVGMVIGSIGAIAAIATVLFVFRRKNDPQFQSASRKKMLTKVPSEEVKGYHGASSPASTHSQGGNKTKQSEQAGLIFIRDDVRVKFDLQDLLRASAEVLGSGSFGSSYKAVLLSGPSMVVKRFRLMNNVAKEEFQEHMRRLGRLSHPNLSSVVSYYYRREEKLLVSEFAENGSLAYQLHGNRSADRPGLTWPLRLKIVKGVAKCLAYLYKELPSLIVPHGHLKSSNVLLNESFEPLLADYALVPLINQEHATQLMVAYKSPEYAQFGRTTKKTDIWSFGVLILEILTGKFPSNYLQQAKGSNGGNSDLASWVKSVVKGDDWTAEVFDKDMKGTQDAEEEMMKLLKIGLGCCEEDVEKRLDWKEVVEKIEELKDRGGSSSGRHVDYDDDNESYASEG